MPAKIDIKMAYGLRVKELREAIGLSQDKFAYSIGISRSYLAGIETGKRTGAR